jgi:hypothetical protein
VSPEQFEALVRRELAQRDARRRARIGDPYAQAEADQLFVNAVMGAAGHPPSAEGVKVLARARRARRLNEEAAFGDLEAS